MANSDGPLKIEDLERLCEEHEAESLFLEFKTCNELRPRGGVDAKGRPRSLDNVKKELSRDVSAFLNSAGGRIIYGIREDGSSSGSWAKETDRKGAFQGKDPREDRVTEWIRAHVQPPPHVNVYSVLVDRDDPESSPWFLVVEIPQGLLAYMAKDDIFHKRVSNVRKHMAQYEVMDVMNRARGATLDLRLGIVHGPIALAREGQPFKLLLSPEVTSANFVASLYGALRITVAPPLNLADARESRVWPQATFKEASEIRLSEEERVGPCQSLTISWGASRGSGDVILPGVWHDFYENSVPIVIPQFASFPIPYYLIQTQLFTMNRPVRRDLYAVVGQAGTGWQFHLTRIDDTNRDELLAGIRYAVENREWKPITPADG